ncbi:MAG: GntR family transcriptional regulator [Chloroflexi bacterium]|nr:GntR family transcriptional regulator [Chloroflexota bacterium]
MEIHFPVELQRQIEQAIVAGELPVGQLVNATELAARFDASLDEIQEVLRSEHRKGLLARDGANGFRVLGLSAPQVESVFQHTSKVGFKPSSVMRGVTIEPASSEIAAKLDLPIGAPVYRLERTRLVNGEVLANQTNVIPYQVCAGLENDDVSHASFQQLIDGKYRAVTTEMKEEFAMATATAQDQAILGLDPGAPILVIQRLALSATSSPLIWTDIHVRPDRFDYVAALWSPAKTLLEQFQLT